MRALTVAVSLATFLWGCGQVAPELPSKDRLHLFLLIGQSNMAGRGDVEGQDQTVDPRVLTLTADSAWEYAVDPIHFDKPVAGVGLGRSFGRALAERDPSITVGLIPAAVGGSPIDTWVPGATFDQTGTNPYDDAITRARAAMQDGTLTGILWHQGESDSRPELASGYATKLHALIERFRRDLDDPDVPFVVGQLGQFEDQPWSEDRERVNTAHTRVPGWVTGTTFISSDGLLHKGDGVHFGGIAAHVRAAIRRGLPRTTTAPGADRADVGGDALVDGATRTPPGVLPDRRRGSRSAGPVRCKLRLAR